MHSLSRNNYWSFNQRSSKFACSCLVPRNGMMILVQEQAVHIIGRDRRWSQRKVDGDLLELLTGLRNLSVVGLLPQTTTRRTSTAAFIPSNKRQIPKCHQLKHKSSKGLAKPTRTTFASSLRTSSRRHKFRAVSPLLGKRCLYSDERTASIAEEHY